MGKIKRKGESGNATRYITRNRAIKKLQISLNDFRRLCILKGIHPHEPKNKKKANKGSSGTNTFYYSKDIQYLMYEPLIESLREKKTFAKKLMKAKAKKQEALVKKLKENAPVHSLNHIVKERYPTFIDALRDLDDALSMIFLFATMPPADRCSKEIITDCQQLSREFLHYVIKSRCLRKVFLSIKGIYYQAEIKGQVITWIVPYQFSQKVPKFVDFKVMLQFLEFYRVLLGFVNFRLYSELNLKYPPVIDKQLEASNAELNALIVKSKDELEKVAPKSEKKRVSKEVAERLESLDEKISTIAKQTVEGVDYEEQQEADATELDIFPEPLDEKDGDSREVLKAFNESSALNSFQSLFANQVIYLSREVPKNSLEFLIRSFGGKVGWDSSVAGGSPFDESSDSITFQISDRSVIPNRRTDRVYVQPQWIYDCINAKKLLTEAPYFPGKSLPPHLSPFVTYKQGDYVPEEAYQFDGEIQGNLPARKEEEEANDSDIEGASEDEVDEEESETEEANEEDEVPTPEVKETKSKKRANPTKQANLSEKDDVKEMGKIMMNKKQRYLYNRMQHGIANKSQETSKLEEKKKTINTRSKAKKA